MFGDMPCKVYARLKKNRQMPNASETWSGCSPCIKVLNNRVICTSCTHFLYTLFLFYKNLKWMLCASSGLYVLAIFHQLMLIIAAINAWLLTITVDTDNAHCVSNCRPPAILLLEDNRKCYCVQQWECIILPRGRESSTEWKQSFRERPFGHLTYQVTP